MTDYRIRDFSRRDATSVAHMLTSDEASMPYMFHSLNTSTIVRIITFRNSFEKFIDRIRRFSITLSPENLYSSVCDRKIIVAEELSSYKIIGAAFTSNVSGGTWSLDIIAVDRKYQGKGIGSMLLEHVVEIVRKANGAVLTTRTGRNESALDFYVRRGFKSTYDLVELELNVSKTEL